MPVRALTVPAGDLPDEGYRAIVDGSALPYVVIGRDGVIRFAGQSAAGLLGWTAEELVGRNMVEFIPAHDIDLALDVIAEIESIDGRYDAGDGVPMVFSVLCKGGDRTSVEIGAMPLLDMPAVDGIALRLRPWDAQQHFDAFLAALLADEPLDDVLVSLARSIAAALYVDGAAIHHGFDGDRFASASGWGVPGDALLLDEGPWCEAARDGVPSDVDAQQLPPAAADVVTRAGLATCWSVPVPSSDGVAPAVLTAWRTTPGGPLIGHRHVLERSTRFVQLALVRTAEHQRLRHLAGHDALTGVANRAEFRERLAHAVAIGERNLAVAFCDLDGFKPVNDRWGHRAGDRVLVQVAERLRASLRTGDELARIGGDEFTVLLRNVPDGPTALHVAERLRECLDEPFGVAGEQVVIGLSVGVALTRPGATADTLLAGADAALYEVKRAGGGKAYVAP